MSRFCLTVHRWGVLYLYIGKIYIDPVDRRQLAKGWRHSRQHCSPPAWRRIMDIATRILSGSPWWVYGLLALLIWLGLQAARPRTVSLSRVLIAPAVFIGWGIVRLMLRANFSDVLIWLGTAVRGAAFAVPVTPFHGLVADPRPGLARAP